MCLLPHQQLVQFVLPVRPVNGLGQRISGVHRRSSSFGSFTYRPRVDARLIAT
jgi:hypothetical protein